MAEQVVEKVCAKCGTDVSKAQRTKDKKGRYWCMDCYKRAVAERKAAQQTHSGEGAKAGGATPPPIPTERDLTEQLVAEASKYQENVCPACRSAMAEGAIICTSCGFNKSTNRQAKTRIRKEKGPRPGAGLSAPDMGGLTGSPAVLFVAGLAGALLPLAAYASPDLLLPAILVGALISLAVTIWVIVQGFLTSVVSGVLLIVTAFIPLVNLIYWLYFIYFRNENEALKLVFAGYFVGSFLLLPITLAAPLPGMEEMLQDGAR